MMNLRGFCRSMNISIDIADQTAQPAQARELYRELEPVLRGSSVALDPTKVEALLRVLGNSNFLARWARRHPDAVAEILSQDLSTPYSQDDFFAEFSALLQDTNLEEERLADLLLERKYRHLFRISLRDVGMGRPFREIVAEFSALARAIVQISLDWQWKNFRKEYGPALNADASKAEIPFCILALGKLGGDELNFSSDIDILYFYGSDQGRIPRRSDWNPHEYFTKLAERLSAFLRKKTAEGFLYRVDLELRPEGKSGTLVNGIDALEDYYESFGADWEKQALIRASLAAGDRDLCQDFLRRIHPFVFPKMSDFGFLDRLARMKEKILESIRKRLNQSFHVKLGEGGIREAEFFVQSLQLLFGGLHPELQVANTLEVLPRLRDAGLIEASEEAALEKAYSFLRTMEHRLQLAEEQQTHELPESDDELRQLARRMGYADRDANTASARMLGDLQLHRQTVQGMFNDLISKRYEV